MLRYLLSLFGLVDESRGIQNRADLFLYTQLLSFNLDREGVNRPFSVRLREKTGWSEEFAQLAMGEYIRFIFLAYLSSKRGGVAVPSQTVDEVWHLHLQDTRSYWTHLCGDVLKKEIHHYPAESSSEDDHYSGQYVETLRLYLSTFGSVPPAEIWGPMPESLKPKVRETSVSSSSSSRSNSDSDSPGFFAGFFGGCGSSGVSDSGSSAASCSSSSSAGCASAGCGGGGCGGGGCGGGGCGGA